MYQNQKMSYSTLIEKQNKTKITWSIDTEKAFEQIHDLKKKKIMFKYSTNRAGKELPQPDTQHLRKAHSEHQT